MIITQDQQVEVHDNSWLMSPLSLDSHKGRETGSRAEKLQKTTRSSRLRN